MRNGRAIGGNDDPGPSSYAEWRRRRVVERLETADDTAEAWNYLITVIVWIAGVDDDKALQATFASLRAQTYRNVEVLVLGEARPSPETADFSGCRGLFHERGHDAIGLLAEAACDRLWRGDYVMFAAAGTTFDNDAFQLLNAALNRSPERAAPDLVVVDHDCITQTGEFTTPSFLPGWDPDLIQSFDYVGAAFLTSRALVVQQRGGERPASLHEWLAGVAATLPGVTAVHVTETIVHIPEHVHCPAPRSRTPSQPRVEDAAQLPGMAIVIPNRNRPDLLTNCLKLMALPKRFAPELVIVDNASDDAQTLAIYDELRTRCAARIVAMDRRFNFSRMVNIGVAASSADVVLLLNNDVEVTAPGLLEQMLAHALRPEVGVVGSKLLYSDGTVQHGGILLREGPSENEPVIASHVLRGAVRSDGGYLGQLEYVRNYQVVTGAILAVRRAVFDRVGGFDEVALPIEYNDIDFCLKVRREGLRVIMLPLDGIIHSDGASRRGGDPALAVRSRTEARRVMAGRWAECFVNDPFRNPWVDMSDVPQARFPWSPPVVEVSVAPPKPAEPALRRIYDDLRRIPHRLGRSVKKRIARPISRYMQSAAFDSLMATIEVPVKVSPLAKPPKDRASSLRAPTHLKEGLSLTGHVCSEIGLGQSIRALAGACDTQRLPISLCNLPLPDRQNEDEFRTKCNPVGDRKANLLVVAVPEIVLFEAEVRAGRLNILYPFWELSRLPKQSLAKVNRFDHIWAPSTFVASAFKDAGVPVHVVPQPVPLRRCQPLPRRPRERLTFLTYLDFDSSGVRKNPAAAITAFQQAFAPERNDVELVVKTRGVDDRGLRSWLAERAASDRRIRVIDRTLDRAGMDMLMADSDVFVSLHRSEGFGFGPAEALAIGKPVIATDYGGTTDFITPATGYPIDYDLIPVQAGEYVYTEGQVWADPRLQSAVTAMRAIYDDPADAEARARRGFSLLQERHAPHVIGAEIARMLQGLGVIASGAIEATSPR